ncbi:3-hydroxyisobutyrate dehydrogenase [Alkalimarinus alittae]|uniref:3-hydroxyisobutyrate dehydrogenase n=1 Tax=Alkalimarinus alittae TaxID=2961619 RepID=A0ABY6N3H8_9ALTE|nr:3-hydroxyisobutyrate dehydrogenase [Alkalimarinus alittae]UZE96594.1 3-hydroxyisobutyrate dehydrogenase [Alkalimarinus alittae]
MKKVGFIGLGHMGAPMALNLLKAGYDLKVFDLNPTALKALADAGAATTASAMDAANDVDVLITMLPSSPHVKQLYIGEGALLQNISGQPLIIDCSTIAPDAAKEVAAAARRRGLDMLDAPVSGGVAGAEAGTLTFIVGGEASALKKGTPLFNVMGKNVFHAGDNGAGQVAKICNNMLLGIQMISTAEALQLGVNNGLDPAVLSGIMNKSSGNNWALEVYNPYPGVMDNVPASREYEGGFLVDLMSKDLGLATEAMLSSKSSTPMGSLAKSLYALHASKGNGDLDFSSIQKLFQP